MADWWAQRSCEQQGLLGRFARFFVGGRGVDATLYVMDPLLTRPISGSETASATKLTVGTLLDFRANRSLTFRHRGGRLIGLDEVLACYAIVYLIDFTTPRTLAGQRSGTLRIIQGCGVVVLSLLAWIIPTYGVSPVAAGAMGRVSTRIVR